MIIILVKEVWTYYGNDNYRIVNIYLEYLFGMYMKLLYIIYVLLYIIYYNVWFYMYYYV